MADSKKRRVATNYLLYSVILGVRIRTENILKKESE